MNRTWGSSIKYVRRIFRKTNISNPQLRTVRIRGLEMLVFRKILRTYLMDNPLVKKLVKTIFFVWFSLQVYLYFLLWAAITEWNNREKNVQSVPVFLFLQGTFLGSSDCGGNLTVEGKNGREKSYRV